ILAELGFVGEQQRFADFGSAGVRVGRGDGSLALRVGAEALEESTELELLEQLNQTSTVPWRRHERVQIEGQLDVAPQGHELPGQRQLVKTLGALKAISYFALELALVVEDALKRAVLSQKTRSRH